MNSTTNEHGTGANHCVPAKEPTQALPGSAEKILVLMERATKCQALFHQCDRRLGEDDTRDTMARKANKHEAPLPRLSTWAKKASKVYKMRFARN